MIENWKISARQFRILVTLCFIGTTILRHPGALAKQAKQDAWIAVILGIVVGLLLVWLYNSIGKLFTNMTLIESIEKLLGKWLGKLISLLFIFFLLITCATRVYLIGEFITIQIMPETPIQFTNIIFVVVLVMGTRLGLESFARAAEILYPWVIGLFIILVLFVSKDIEFQNIQPVFEYGMKPIIRGALFFSSYSSLSLVSLLMIFPSCVTDINEAKKSFLEGTIIGGIMILIITTLTILVLGHDIAALNTFTSYALAKKISLGNFLQRIEIIIAILWWITIFYSTIFCFYGAALGLAQTLKLKDYRPLTLPLGMILVVLSLVIFPSVTYASTFTSTTFIPYTLTYGFFLPLLLFLIGKIRKIKV